MSKAEVMRLAEQYVATQLKTMSKGSQPIKLSSDQRRALVKSAARKVVAIAK
jgi:hypothetical protein